MASPVAVLLLDDGELDDVQKVLDGLGVAYGRVRGGAIASRTPPPAKLLVTTPRRIDVVQLPENEPSENDGVVRIVVVNEDSPTLRSHLREIGIDFLVRRPVHPEALRLLLVHCLYSGRERRLEPRIPVGFEVSFRTGFLPRKATMADLSSRGCRLLSNYALEPGKRITVSIPESIGIAEAITLKGRIIRMSLDEHLGQHGPYSAAVSFDELPSATRHELEWILEERARGPATLGSAQTRADPDGTAPEHRPIPPETQAPDFQHVEVDVRMTADTDFEQAGEALERELPPLEEAAAAARKAVRLPPAPPVTADATAESAPPAASREPSSRPATPAAAPPATPVATPTATPTTTPAATTPAAPAQSKPVRLALPEPEIDPNERRKNLRGAYPRRVPAFGERAMRVLMGRDLSMRGMRVERTAGLEMGDRLHLAVYGNAEEEPFLVWATVCRDDGPLGMALEFDDVHPVVGEQLEAVLADLPAVESLQVDETRAMGSVVTEILDD